MQRLTHPSAETPLRHTLDLKSRMDVLKDVTSRGIALLTPEISTKALGKNGSDGDEETIRIVVTAVVVMYAEL